MAKSFVCIVMGSWSSRAENAANYLAKTDEEYASLKVGYEKSKRKAKRIWSAIYLRVEGTIAERQALAETDDEYQAAVTDEMDALLKYEKIRNRRDSASEIIHWWMSYQKAQREGQVL